MLMIALPAATTDPTLLHAWIASSIVHLTPRESAYWRQKALVARNNALKGLRKAVEKEGRSNLEWIRATMLMRHIFDVAGPKPHASWSNSLTEIQQLHQAEVTRNQDPNLAVSHLEAANTIFSKRLYSQVPTSQHELLLLEAYILGAGFSYLFHPEWDLPHDHVDTRLDLLCLGLGVQSTPFPCPWIGWTGFDVLRVAYRLSWLAHRVPLTGPHLYEAIILSRKFSRANDTRKSARRPRRLASKAIIAEAYEYACSLLGSVILEMSGEAHPTKGQAAFDAGTSALKDALSQNNFSLSSVLLWPAIIFAMGANTEELQAFYRQAFNKLEYVHGLEATERALSLVEGLWQLASSGCYTPAMFVKELNSHGVFM
jgi:hypothetical protein